MEQRHKAVLLAKRQEITRHLRFRDIRRHLVDNGILNGADIDEIENNETRADEVKALLDLLPSRGPNAFTVFRDALRDRYPHLAQVLQDETPTDSGIKEPRVFVIHAGEDKESFVRPLVTELLQQGLAEKDIFFDDVSIEPGDVIREKILSTLSSGTLELAVIVVSTSFLNKPYWPKLEFETCLKNNKRIFPIWVDANKDKFKAFSEQVGKYSPTLKQLSARRVQRDDVTDELPIIAAEVVRRLSTLDSGGPDEPTAIQTLLSLAPSSFPTDLGSSDEDVSIPDQESRAAGVTDEQRLEDKLKKEKDIDLLAKVGRNQLQLLKEAESLLPKEMITSMAEKILNDTYQGSLHILKVKMGCAIIHLVPDNLTALELFWRDYRSGQLSINFSDCLLTNEMRTVVGKDLVVRVIMLEDQYRQWKRYFQKTDNVTEEMPGKGTGKDIPRVLPVSVMAFLGRRPRARQKASPQEMLAEGTEFLQFLEQQNLLNQDVTKQQLKSIYEGSYTMSKPLSRRRKGTAFSQVLRALRKQNKVQVGRSGNVVIGTGEFLVATALEQHLGMRSLQSQLEAQGDADGGAIETVLPDDPALREQKLLSWIKNHRDALVRNKFDVEVTCEQDGQNGHIDIPLQKRASFSTCLQIRNTSRHHSISFLSCEMLWRKPQFQLTDDDHVASGLGEHLLGPGEEYHVKLRVSPIRGYTRHFVPVIFHFCRRVDNKNFHIARFLSAGIDDELIRSLAPTKPYKPAPRVNQVERWTQELEGVKPDPPQRDALVMDRLHFYGIPDHLRWQLRGRGSDKLSGELSSALTFAGYSGRFGKLLHTEEIQMEVDIQRYNMEKVPLRLDSNPRLLSLTVPGLAENRPSVLKGDHLFVQERFGDRVGATRYKGYVHHTELLEVKLGFHNQLINRFITGMTVDVQFTFARLPLRLMHRAVQEAAAKPMMSHVLFPKASSVGVFQNIRDPYASLRFYDRLLQENEEQNRAVRHIVAGTSRPAPYLIFGPPGTGKTMTTVEAIKQVHTLDRGSVILACAPSNSAADLLAQRLIKHAQFKASLFRMNAVSRRWDSLPQDLKSKEANDNVCNYDSRGEVYFPSMEEIMQKYRIVVTTLVTAGRLASANFPPGHFTHIFIDESGHAVEPEAVIPVSGLLSPEKGGQLVMAGDPKQLGPVLRSPVAIKHGLAMSLLERLMTQCPLYQRGEDGQYDSRVLTKLVRNYRSHPAIIEEPKNMFYYGKLEVYADPLVRESLCRWKHLPTENFPVIFHGVEGTDEREGNSPSFFNAREVATVLDYVHELLSSRGGMRVTQKDIGIISPYRRQVQKIQQALKLKNHSDIKVGSVEEFQGQERLIIIVSTVRSTRQEYLKMDKDYNLGFLNNPKRFNVAITRAKALLVVVGNPYTLSRDKYWGRFLEYCRRNGGYHPDSCEFQPRADEVEDVLQRFAKVNLDGTSDTDSDSGYGSEFSHVQQQEDPEWRREY